MTQYVNVPLSDRAYRRFKRWAEKRQENLEEAIANYLVENMPDDSGSIVSESQADPQVEREKAAYIKLHPQLVERYAGDYVAIYNGQLVDHDSNYGALFERVDDRFPDTFVWLTRVEKEPIGTIVVRSPRFVEEST